MLPSCKKRRRDDDHNASTLEHPNPNATLADIPIPLYDGFCFISPALLDANHALYSSPPSFLNHSPRSVLSEKTHQNYQSPLTRRIIPLPSPKRQRTTVEREEGMRSRSTSPTAQRHAPTRRGSEPNQEPSTANNRTATRPPTNSAALMNRCHICYRKQTRKADLDSFTDCQGCGQRTCYVCIRECAGWGPNQYSGAAFGGNNGLYQTLTPSSETPMEDSINADSSFTMLDVDEDQANEVARNGIHHAAGHPPLRTSDARYRPEERQNWGGQHRGMICRKCCIEKGVDGDIICFGCLSYVEG